MGNSTRTGQSSRDTKSHEFEPSPDIHSLDEVLRIVATRLRDKPAAIKIRFDNDRVDLDSEIPDHLAKARAVRKLVGNDFPLAFDANNG
jgi:L-alanine-DL-glutamate epimerase-like enolase superfamily enzyme